MEEQSCNKDVEVGKSSERPDALATSLRCGCEDAVRAFSTRQEPFRDE